MINVKVTNISWDVDEDDAPVLPSEEYYSFEDDTDEDEIEDFVSDKLSDDYGYCHNGFSYIVSRPIVAQAGD